MNFVAAWQKHYTVILFCFTVKVTSHRAFSLKDTSLMMSINFNLKIKDCVLSSQKTLYIVTTGLQSFVVIENTFTPFSVVSKLVVNVSLQQKQDVSNVRLTAFVWSEKSRNTSAFKCRRQGERISTRHAFLKCLKCAEAREKLTFLMRYEILIVVLSLFFSTVTSAFQLFTCKL